MANPKTPFENPFLDGKFEEIFAQFKVPGVEFDDMIAAHRKNVEAITQANQLAVEGLQTAFQRQNEIMQQIVTDSTTLARDLLSEGTPEDKAIAHAERVKKSYETTLSNLKELGDIVANANQEAAEVINKRVAETLTEVKSSLEKKNKTQKKAA